MVLAPDRKAGREPLMGALAPPDTIPSDAPTVGEGRYVLLHRLGEGGQCYVAAAWDTRLRLWRAVKILLEKPAQKERNRRRFLQEADVLQRLKHPNLVRVADVHRDGPQPWMVMELIAGGTLFHWVAAHGEMPPRMAVEAALEVAGALGVAHEAGMVHRDVKPRNVLITADNRCKLSDFGIAQDDSARMTKTGDVFGTLGFMAPEQLEDTQGVDARADIYSLAATLWFLLVQPRQRDLLRLSGDQEQIDRAPEPLRPALGRALAPDPADRQDSMASFAAQLREALPHLDLDPPETPPLATTIIPEDQPITTTGISVVLDPDPFSIADEETVLRRDQPSWVVEEPPRPDPMPPPAPPQPAPEPSRKGLWVLGGASALAIPLVLVGLLTLGCAGSVGWGTHAVDQAADRHDAAAMELQQRLEHERVVLDDLELLGLEVDSARAAVNRWSSEDGEASWIAAVAAVASIRVAASPLRLSGRGDSPEAQTALQRIQRLEHALEAEKQARKAWLRAARGPTGSLATLLGLAPAPPELNPSG